MPTILGGDYQPVEVEDADLVGYLGKEGFAILNPIRSRGRNLPAIPEFVEAMPWCFKCKVQNNQKVNFHGEFATLHNIDGQWHFKSQESGQLKSLLPNSFFEVGHLR